MTRAVLTDIEGTTTSLSFVKDVLFPYARRYIGTFVKSHVEDPDVAASLAEVRRLAGTPDADIDELIALLASWMEEDRKVTPLKALQGLVWEHGYRSSELEGHLYADAVEALRSWHTCGLQLYVYSSGSVHAQKLLFSHTPFGDLTPLFSGYYDTRIGGKLDADSYRRIAQDIGVGTGDVLFLSDVERELDAAREAGMRTCQLIREGKCNPRSAHRQVASFQEITIKQG